MWLLRIISCFLIAISAAAQDADTPKEIDPQSLSKELVTAAEKAKSEYKKDVTVHAEEARLKYVTKLADIASQYRGIDKGSAWNYLQHGWDALCAEIALYPAPKDSDSKLLSKLRVGMWTSGRHDYLFMKDGTWTMLTPTHRATGGGWHIKGNQYWDNVAGDGTIILLNKEYFIFTALDNQTFFEDRLPDHPNPDDDYKAADKEMNAVYQKILGELEPSESEKIKKAQRAWIAYRDADATARASIVNFYQCCPGEYILNKTELTQERTKILQDLLQGL